jgi:aryl-alcohol dehydrogenase-like predicted oxidoreductase
MSYHYGSYFGAANTGIPQTTLGKTGLKVGRLGLGTWELGNQNISVPETKKIIGTLLDHGGNLIDTSDNYDGAELLIGRAIKEFNRDDIVIVTKCGDYTKRTFDPLTALSTNDPKYKHYNLNFTPKVIKRNVEDSLKNLGVDHLDVLLIHTCFLKHFHQGDVIDAIIRAKEEGKVRFIGYSGDNAEVIYSAQIPEFSVMEMSLNIADMRNAKIPLSVTKKHNFGTIIKRPVGNAFWRKDLYLVAQVYAKEYKKRAKKMGIRPSDVGLSNNKDGWIQMDVLAVGTTRLDHMKQNIDIVSKFGDKSNKELRNTIISKFEAAQKRIKKYADNKVWRGLE